jgi:hypothetical protein
VVLLARTVLTALCVMPQGEDFLDSYIGFVAAGYSLKVRRQAMRCSVASEVSPSVNFLAVPRRFDSPRRRCTGNSSRCSASWRWRPSVSSLLCTAFRDERRSLLPVCAGVFAVDGAFNAAVTPDISGALAPVVQPFLGQLITGALHRVTVK